MRVANAEMMRALRVMTVERGLDPRDFTLLAFGGAGPLHACELAQALEIRRIVVPSASGVLSALGLAAADRRRDSARSVLLTGFGDDDLHELATGADEVVWEARYRGQSHELALRGVTPRADALHEAFHAAHEERYGYRDAEADIELVTVRTAQVEPGPDLVLRDETGDELEGEARVHLPGATLFLAEGWRATPGAAETWSLEWTR